MCTVRIYERTTPTRIDDDGTRHYEDPDTLYMQLDDGPVWNMGPDCEPGHFAEDARGWSAGEWEPDDRPQFTKRGREYRPSTPRPRWTVSRSLRSMITFPGRLPFEWTPGTYSAWLRTSSGWATMARSLCRSGSADDSHAVGPATRKRRLPSGAAEYQDYLRSDVLPPEGGRLGRSATELTSAFAAVPNEPPWLGRAFAVEEVVGSTAPASERTRMSR